MFPTLPRRGRAAKPDRITSKGFGFCSIKFFLSSSAPDVIDLEVNFEISSLRIQISNARDA
jgi:hypothetical protein